MKKNSWLILCLLTLIAFSACKKNNDHTVGPPPIPDGPYLYVGGSVNSQATLWKINMGETSPDTTMTNISNATLINDIILSDTNVYMAGRSNGRGVYWKNDTAIPVTNANEIDYITVSGANVYTTGFDKFTNAGYWNNNTETNLNNTLPQQSSFSISMSSMVTSGNDVYVTGSICFTGSTDSSIYGNSAVYWKNGNIVYLSNHGYGGLLYQSTTGIAVSGTDVYVSGNIDIDADTLDWCGYWKDSVPIGLYNSRRGASANSTAIALSGTDVYITGIIYSNGVFSAAYWKNGNITMLSGQAANAIAISGSDVYILGIDNQNNTVIWKNGSVYFNLGQVQAFAMAVPTVN